MVGAEIQVRLFALAYDIKENEDPDERKKAKKIYDAVVYNHLANFSVVSFAYSNATDGCMF